MWLMGHNVVIIDWEKSYKFVYILSCLHGGTWVSCLCCCNTMSELTEGLYGAQLGHMSHTSNLLPFDCLSGADNQMNF